MMTSNVRCGIVAPKFCNLKLYNDGFKVSVSLHISQDIYDELREMNDAYKPIQYRGKCYLHWEKSFHYACDSFDEAYEEAFEALHSMKICIRRHKIVLLSREIDVLQDSRR